MTALVSSLAERVDAVLPQTQCRQCGFEGCRPYASAIAHGMADIDRCPPGGRAGVVKLAAVTGLPVRPLDATRGSPKPLVLAIIDESACIGCTLCIQACPVDAIVGGAKRMHVVVVELCTGCELCVPPCPVDCIALVAADFAWDDAHADQARARHRRRDERLRRLATTSTAASAGASVEPAPAATSQKQAILAGAIERARALAAARAR